MAARGRTASSLVKRTTQSVIKNNPFFQHYPFNVHDSSLPTVHLETLYQRSFRSLDRIHPQQIRRFSRTGPAQKAMSKITAGVLNLKWDVSLSIPLEEADEDISALNTTITNALKAPNQEIEQGSWRTFLNCIIEELLVRNAVLIERAFGGHSGEERLWLWANPIDKFEVNKNWVPHLAGVIPKFLGPGLQGPKTPFMDEQMFMIVYNPSVGEFTPPSPMEVAYRFIDTFLNLSDFQRNSTGRGVKSYILNLVEAGEEEVEIFRTYWNNTVEGEGKLPIVGGKGVKAERIGARSDEELYPKYSEFILRMIALCFNLSARDMNIEERDNRATAEVAADTSFTDAIYPMGDCVIDGLNTGGVAYYHPKHEVSLNSLEKRKEEVEANIAGTLYEKNVFTRNEARRKVGAKPCPGGDVFVDGTTITGDQPEEDETLTNSDESRALGVNKKRKEASKREEEQAIEAGKGRVNLVLPPHEQYRNKAIAQTNGTYRDRQPVPKPVEESIRRKQTAHNARYTNSSQKASLESLRKVWHRGAQVCDEHHLNADKKLKQKWGMARVNAYLFLLRTNEPKVEGYIADNDLLPRTHPLSLRQKKRMKT